MIPRLAPYDIKATVMIRALVEPAYHVVHILTQAGLIDPKGTIIQQGNLLIVTPVEGKTAQDITGFLMPSEKE